MMWRTALLLVVSSFTVIASAQQLKPLSVDGTLSQSGVLVYKGKSYVSLDALRQAGATYSSKGLYVYTQPMPGGPALKLSGCLNQKLYNNAYYVTVQAPKLVADDQGQGAWQVPFTLQPLGFFRVGNSDNTNNPGLDLKDAVVTFKDGSRFAQRTLPVAQSSLLGGGSGDFQNKQIDSTAMVFRRDENEVESNPPIKLALPPSRLNGSSAPTYPGVTIDLTCMK